jgi:hypothetical protein
MKVRAIAKGYYDHQIRHPGEVFDLVPYYDTDDKGKKRKVSADDQFASEWMETVDGSVPKSVPKPGANQSADGKEDPNRVLNPNVDDNRKTMTDVVMAHGGEQDPDKVKAAKKGKDVI